MCKSKGKGKREGEGRNNRTHGAQVSEQERMAHGELAKHRDSMEGGAETRGGAEEAGGASQADSRGARALGVSPNAGAGWLGPVSISGPFR